MLVRDDAEPLDDYWDDPNETVDLYELLDVPHNADTKRIRKRIGEMFSEAQNNVDHRNFRRRFYYRELMETVLPHARHHLLDVVHRGDYDRSIGLLPPLPTPPPFVPPPTSSATDALLSSDNLLVVTRPDAPEIKPPANVASSEAMEEEEIDFSKFMPVVALSGRGSDAENADGGLQNAPRDASHRGVPEHSRMDAERVERRRDVRRRELIKHELQAEGTKWASFAGLGMFFSLGAALLALATALDFSLLKLIAVPLAAGMAALCARYAHRKARRHIITLLSQMPYDQLLQRCAKM